MIPILFGAAESAYTSHGLGPISDATSCIVTEEANGAFDLKMRVPRTTARLAEPAFRSTRFPRRTRSRRLRPSTRSGSAATLSDSGRI